MSDRKFNLEERLLDFSVKIIKAVEALPNTRVGNHIAGQLIKSGTSPYANHGEAQAAESPQDFIHKLRICLKELRETKRWLELIEKAQLLKEKPKLIEMIEENEELIKIFVASIKTADKNRNH
ncbi:MAG: four helix bundle protein [Desulfobacterales bacterium]|nr:four helix bundle protein [Desulfobacterales bacterium]